MRFDCAEYYSFENKLIKIVNKKDSIRMFNFYDSLPGKTGITSFDTFYFYNDTLIKAIRRDYDPNPVTISHFYFAGDDLVEMEKR